MARQRRTYKSPFVLTFAAAVLPACVTTPFDGEGSGGSPSIGGSPTSGGVANAGGSPSIGGTQPSTGGVIIGAGGAYAVGGSPDIPLCPPDLVFDPLSGRVPMNCGQGSTCLLYMNCTSGGDRGFVLECPDGNGFVLSSTECDSPAEFCTNGSESAICSEDDVWHYQGMGGNPPAPCPLEAPVEGSSCNAGHGFGADRSMCGYQCADSGWTVLGCVASSTSPGPGTWESDGACGGIGGEGGSQNDAPNR